MDFRIIGANRDTGDELIVTVEAKSLEHAEHIARQLAMLVNRIELCETENPRATAAATMHWIAEPGTRNMDPPPQYLWLTIIGWFWVVVGGVIVLATVMLFVLTVAGITEASTRPNFSPGMAGAAGTLAFFWFGFWFLVGAGCAAFGQAILAIRDIAQNSWRLPAINRSVRSGWSIKPVEPFSF